MFDSILGLIVIDQKCDGAKDANRQTTAKANVHIKAISFNKFFVALFELTMFFVLILMELYSSVSQTL